jgi:hypothetical protein
VRYQLAMTPLEQDILETLVKLEQAVESMRTARPKPNLLPVFARLDELAAQLPSNADPELRHFLQKKSYQKARELLQGVQAERGSCRK